MSNPVVTTLCAGAICCAIQGSTYWVGPLLITAMVIAIWNNFGWSKVFKAAAKVLAKQ